jgi:RNA polymerase primary sigma factor
MSNKKIKFVNEESVSKYFRELKDYELLSHNEVINLAKRIKENDIDAVDILVKGNLKFVITIAREYQGNGLPLSDLISEGNLGLIKAAYKYDHTMGFKFISYAVWWVRQTIIDS